MDYSLMHLVWFQFKAGTPESVHESMKKDAGALKTSIRGISFSIDFRATSSVEQSKGFTHVLHTQFINSKDLSDYEQHPLYLQFVNKYKPYVLDVIDQEIVTKGYRAWR